MNEQLQAALAELIGKANSGVDAASGFLMAELPDVIYQLLLWYGVHSAVMFLIGIAYVVACYKAIKWTATGWRLEKQKELIAEGLPTPIFYMFFVLLIIPLEYLFSLTWLKIWIAPKIWLMEYAATLAK